MLPAKPKRLVLDANILIRATLGRRARHLIDSYAESIYFCAPDTGVADARRNAASIAIKRGQDPTHGLLILDELVRAIEAIDSSYYEPHASAARDRIASRDVEDWPIVATALLLDCPIWTEDLDFFGCGIATWTTATVELYLRDSLRSVSKTLRKYRSRHSERSLARFWARLSRRTPKMLIPAQPAEAFSPYAIATAQPYRICRPC